MSATSRLTVDTARSNICNSRIDEPEGSHERFPRVTQREREERTRPDGRSNPTVTRQPDNEWRNALCHKARPISCSVCPAFPTTPHVEFLIRRKPKPSPLFHKTTFENSFHTRWCCIDRLNRRVIEK